MILKVISAVKIPVKTWKGVGMRSFQHLGWKEPLAAGSPYLLTLAPGGSPSRAASSDCAQNPSGCLLGPGPLPWGHLQPDNSSQLCCFPDMTHQLGPQKQPSPLQALKTDSSGRHLGSGEAGADLDTTQLQTRSSPCCHRKFSLLHTHQIHTFPQTLVLPWLSPFAHAVPTSSLSV